MEVDADGSPVSRELRYARRMTESLETFAPDASEELRLAVRCQHIRRWEIPRSTFPMNRIGYRRWRSALAEFHARTAGEIMREAGYEESTVARVQDIVQKRRLKKDSDVQTLEDVACLVFLEHYLHEFALAHDDAKVVDILRKTWPKMSVRGQERALELDLPTQMRHLVKRALAG